MFICNPRVNIRHAQGCERVSEYEPFKSAAHRCSYATQGSTFGMLKAASASRNTSRSRALPTGVHMQPKCQHSTCSRLLVRLGIRAVQERCPPVFICNPRVNIRHAQGCERVSEYEPFKSAAHRCSYATQGSTFGMLKAASSSRNTSRSRALPTGVHMQPKGQHSACSRLRARLGIRAVQERCPPVFICNPRVNIRHAQGC